MMIKKLLFLVLACGLSISCSSSKLSTVKQLNSSGYWIYGFEQSIFRTCDGKQYWLWLSQPLKDRNQSNIRYSLEGEHHFVNLVGSVAPPAPEENMNSPLKTLNVTDIRFTKGTCK